MEEYNDQDPIRTLGENHRTFVRRYQTDLRNGDAIDKDFFLGTINMTLTHIKYIHARIELSLSHDDIPLEKRTELTDYLDRVNALMQELEDSIKRFEGSDEA